MSIQIPSVKEAVSNVTNVKVMYVIADSLFAHVDQNPPLCKLIDVPLEFIEPVNLPNLRVGAESS
jgi:hypothetical protein